MRASLTRRGLLVGTVASATAPTFSSRAIIAGGPKVHDVKIKSFKFDPETLVVNVGDTIRWTNLDVAPHTATAMDKSWDTKRLNRKKAAELVVTADMELNYFCAFHPHMKASIEIVG